MESQCKNDILLCTISLLDTYWWKHISKVLSPQGMWNLQGKPGRQLHLQEEAFHPRASWAEPAVLRCQVIYDHYRWIGFKDLIFEIHSGNKVRCHACGQEIPMDETALREHTEPGGCPRPDRPDQARRGGYPGTREQPARWCILQFWKYHEHFVIISADLNFHFNNVEIIPRFS